MPYKFQIEKKKIPKRLNLTRKLTLKEKEEIKKLYGLVSQRQLAKKFKVSRRLIIFIGCPEKYKRNLELRKKRLEKEPQKYYNREKHNKSMLNYRRRKQLLNKLGKLKGGNKEKMEITKEALNNFINKRIEESERFLSDNGTCFNEVIEDKDTNDYSEESQNNNFEAGIIEALLELKKEFDL